VEIVPPRQPLYHFPSGFVVLGPAAATTCRNAPWHFWQTDAHGPLDEMAAARECGLLYQTAGPGVARAKILYKRGFEASSLGGSHQHMSRKSTGFLPKLAYVLSDMDCACRSTVGKRDQTNAESRTLLSLWINAPDFDPAWPVNRGIASAQVKKPAQNIYLRGLYP